MIDADAFNVGVFRVVMFLKTLRESNLDKSDVLDEIDSVLEVLYHLSANNEQLSKTNEELVLKLQALSWSSGIR